VRTRGWQYSTGEDMEDVLSLRSFDQSRESARDEGILAEAARADPSAFGELYERYYSRVYRYVYHRMGNAADTEDVTAIVFMKALEGLRSYTHNQNGFAPWLFRIARNAVVDHYRRRRPLANIGDALLEQPDPDGDPTLGLLGQEAGEQLRALVERLSAEQREVVLLRYAADLTYPEIAASLRKTEPAVRMLLHRGLRRLKEVLEHDRP
jgi:RNA polymerase sigma-70 factor, ECF subfamily